MHEHYSCTKVWLTCMIHYCAHSSCNLFCSIPFYSILSYKSSTLKTKKELQLIPNRTGPYLILVLKIQHALHARFPEQRTGRSEPLPWAPVLYHAEPDLSPWSVLFVRKNLCCRSNSHSRHSLLYLKWNPMLLECLYDHKQYSHWELQRMS